MGYIVTVLCLLYIACHAVFCIVCQVPQNIVSNCILVSGLASFCCKLLLSVISIIYVIIIINITVPVNVKRLNSAYNNLRNIICCKSYEITRQSL